MRKLILKSPTYDEFVQLLLAWRVWAVGAILGAAVASLVYVFIPPQYRAQATVLVDQHAEQVIPQERSDLLIYTYLQRETDKLKEIAWSDPVLSQLSSETGVPVSQMRNETLHLSQPSDGGWHFLADASNPSTAAAIASAWAKSFVEAVQAKPAGISTFLEVNFTQAQDLPVSRAVSMGVYVFCGGLLRAAIFAFGVLFIDRKVV